MRVRGWVNSRTASGIGRIGGGSRSDSSDGGGGRGRIEVTDVAFLGETTPTAVVATTLLAAFEVGVGDGGGGGLRVVEAIHGGGEGIWKRRMRE